MANRKKTTKSASKADHTGLGGAGHAPPRKERRRHQQDGDGGEYAPPKQTHKSVRGGRTSTRSARSRAASDDDDDYEMDDDLETDDPPAAAVARPRFLVKLSRAPAVSSSEPSPVAGPSAVPSQDGEDASAEEEEDDDESIEREEERHIIAEVSARVRSRRSSARGSLASQDVTDEDETVDHVLLELAHLPFQPAGQLAASDDDEDEQPGDEFDFDRLLALATTGDTTVQGTDPMTSWFVEKDPSLSDGEASSSGDDDDDDGDDESEPDDGNAPLDSDEEADGLLLCASDTDDGGDTTDSLDDADESALIRFGIEADVDPDEVGDVEVTVSVAALADNPALAIAQTAKQLGVDEQTAMRILSDIGYSFKTASPNETASGSGSASASAGPRTPGESPDENRPGPSKFIPEPEMGFFAVPAARPVGTARAVVLDGSAKPAPSPFSVTRTRKRRRESDATGGGPSQRGRRGSVASSRSSLSVSARSQSQVSGAQRGLSPTTEMDFDGDDDGDVSSSQMDLLDVLHASVLTGSPMLLPSGASSSPVTSTRNRGAASLAFSPAPGHGTAKATRATVFLPRPGHLLYSPALVPVASPKQLKKLKGKGKSAKKSKGKGKATAAAVPGAATARRRSRSSQPPRRYRASSEASSLDLEPPSLGCGPVLTSPAITGATSEGLHIPAISLDGF